jgi:hypothetical protein
MRYRSHTGQDPVIGVAFATNQQSLFCIISNWSFPAGKYSFEFPGMKLENTNFLNVTMFPFVSAVSVSVFDLEPKPFSIFGNGFRSGSIQNVSFVPLAGSGNYSCSLSFISSTQYRCGSPPSTLTAGQYILIVDLQESEFLSEVNLGQFNVEVINYPPFVELPSVYVVDENSLAQFSATFGVVSPGRVIENQQSLTVSSKLNGSFGIVFSQSPHIHIDPSSFRLLLNFSTAKQSQVGNFTVIIRIADNGGAANGGLDFSEYILNVRVIAAPRSPFIVTPLNFQYNPRTSSVSNLITTAFGFSLGRQLPYAVIPVVTYSISSCSNVAIFDDQPQFAPSDSSALSNFNRVIRVDVTEHSAHVVTLQFSLALYASGSTSCNMSVIDSTGNSSLFLISFSIPYANRPPALIVPQDGYSFLQRSWYRVFVDLFPLTNVPQQIENAVVSVVNAAFTGLVGVLNSNLVRFGHNHIDFYFNSSEGKSVLGALSLSVYLKTNGPTTSMGSNNATFSIVLNILKQNFPPVIALNSIGLYNPTITVVSTGLEHVLPNVITLVSIGDSDEPSQSLASCNIAGMMDTLGLLDGVVFAGSTGSVTLRPKAHRQGTIFFTVSCKDNGGTLNGGQDESNSIGISITVLLKNSPPEFLPLPTQVSFSEWSFEFQKIEGQAFVYGQSLLSNDFVPSLSSSISLTQVSIGDNPLYGSVSAFQQTLGISSEQLSQIPLNIDDW